MVAVGSESPRAISPRQFQHRLIYRIQNKATKSKSLGLGTTPRWQLMSTSLLVFTAFFDSFRRSAIRVRV